LKFPEKAYADFLESYNSLMAQLSNFSNNYSNEIEEQRIEKLSLLRETLITLLDKNKPIKEFFKSADLIHTDYTEEEMLKIDSLGYLAKNLSSNMKEITKLLREENNP